MIVLAATLGFQGCTDVENAPSYTGRSEGPASKLNVMKDSVKVLLPSASVLPVRFLVWSATATGLLRAAILRG